MDQSRLLLVLGTSFGLCAFALCQAGAIRCVLGRRNRVFDTGIRQRVGVYARRVEEKGCLAAEIAMVCEQPLARFAREGVAYTPSGCGATSNPGDDSSCRFPWRGGSVFAQR